LSVKQKKGKQLGKDLFSKYPKEVKRVAVDSGKKIAPQNREYQKGGWVPRTLPSWADAGCLRGELRFLREKKAHPSWKHCRVGHKGNRKGKLNWLNEGQLPVRGMNRLLSVKEEAWRGGGKRHPGKFPDSKSRQAKKRLVLAIPIRKGRRRKKGRSKETKKGGVSFGS